MRCTAVGILLAAALAMPAEARAQAVFGRVTGRNGAQPNAVLRDPAVSADGTRIVFTSTAGNLGAAANGLLNVYEFRPDGGAVRLLSRNTNGAPANGNCYLPVASLQARYVAYESLADNLGPGAAGLQILRSESGSGPTRRASESIGGAAGNDQSRYPSISADGRFVAFQSFASNLVAADGNSRADIFVKDFADGSVELVSRNAAGNPADDNAAALSTAALSADGRYVVFASPASNMVSGNAGGVQQVYLRDRAAATTVRISESAAGVAGASQSDQAAMSPSGRYVVFRSFAANLVAGATSRVFLRDRQAGTLVAAPLPQAGAFAPPLAQNASACRNPKVADSGHVVMLCDLQAGAPAQAFRWHAPTGDLALLSRATDGTIGNALSGSGIGVSADAATSVFESQAANLVAGDSNGTADVFWHLAAAGLDAIFYSGLE
ncbi:TolB family protein [Tahibacter caeni]|uniref:TolB family protein n=1 Tax=Tahibacter caeni TaxID=1453545 RepID=UPI002148490E|nr:hypothetical protein [Tahibacter caeni]